MRFLSGLMNVVALSGLAGLVQLNHIEEADYRHISLSENARPQAIIVFSGDHLRLEKGEALHDLYQDISTPYLYLSGYDVAGYYPAEVMKAPPEDTRRVFDLAAMDTMDNGRHAAQWIEENGFSEVILLTSEQHMNRSLHELSRHLTTHITVHPVAVQSQSFQGYENERLKLFCRSVEESIGIEFCKDIRDDLAERLPALGAHLS